MIGDSRQQTGPSEGKPFNAGAETTKVSTMVMRGAVLGAGLVLAWLYWPFSQQEVDDPAVAPISGRSQVEEARSMATPGGVADWESWQPGVQPSRSASDGSFLYKDDIAPEQGTFGENQEVSRAGTREGAEVTPGDTAASSDQSDEEPDAEAQLQPISGWVLDRQGEPVAQIEVAASARRLAQDNRTSGSGGGKAAVLTDETGYFAFSDLPEGEYLLETEATDAYDSARATVRTGVSSAVLRVTGDAGTLVTIEGTVTDEQGRPIGGARVAPTDEAQATTTDGAGSYSLQLTVDDRSRTRGLRFTKQGYRGKTDTIQQAQLKEVDRYRLDSQLEAAGDGVAVRGTVLSKDLDPIGGAQVRLSSQQSGYAATTAPDGSFALDDVATGGGYRLWVRPRADFQDYIEEDLEVGGNGPDLPVYLEPLGTASLSGRMVNTFGEPVPRHTLWMWNGGAGANRNLAVTSKGDGSFQVEDVPAGEVTFGSQGSPQFNLGGIRLESGESTRADLVLDWGREELAGVVVGAGGDPVAGAQVTLLWSDAAQEVTSQSKRRTVTDAGGYFIFTELGPGWHTVTVSASGYRAVRREEMPTVPGGEALIQLQETPS